MLKTCLLFFIFLFKIHFYAQSYNRNYLPLREYAPDNVAIYEIAQSYKAELRSLNIEKKQILTEVEKSLTELGDFLKELHAQHLLMATDTLSKYVQELTNGIILKNPNYFSSGYNVFIYRTGVANAASYGQNVILINLELLIKLDNEEELAFVICHELGHDLQKHVINRIIKRSELLFDKSLQNEMKAARSQEYNSSQTMADLYYKYLARSTEHSRVNELEADSLGLKLFIRSGYTPAWALATIQRLDSIDSPTFTTPLALNTIFNFKNFPFKTVWLEFEADAPWASVMDSLYKTPDSLKTHPDCQIRRDKLAAIIKRQPPAAGTRKIERDYLAYKEMALFEKVEHLITRERYGLALYYSLQMLQKYPANDYLKTSAAYCLFEIYSALVNHSFMAVVDMPNNDYPKAYNDFLKFIHNLSGSSLREITKNYFSDHVAPLTNCEYTAFTDILIKSLDTPAENRPQLCQEFASSYKNSYYNAQLTKSLIIPRTPKNEKTKKNKH